MDKKVIKNYIFNLSYQILVLIVPLITTPYVSRRLGVENLGIFSFTMSVVSYFTLFATFSFHVYGQREIAHYQNDQEKRSQLFFEIQFKKLIFCLIGIVTYILFVLAQKKYALVYGINIINVIAVFFDISYFFQGMELFKITVIRNAIVKLVGVILIFILIHNQGDFLLYVGLQCGVLLIGNLTLWVYIKKYVDRKLVKRTSIFRDTKLLLELFVPVISVQLYFSIDKTMLGIICPTMLESGYYDQALKIIRICQTIITSLGTVLISSTARMINEEEKTKIVDTIDSSIRFGLLIATPMFFGILAVADVMVPWFFGSGYEKVAVVMMIMAPILILSAISNVASNGVLVPTNKHNFVSIATITAAIINIILNAILIPRMLSLGATLASVISEIAVMVLCVYFAKDYLYIKSIIINLFKYAIAGAIMFVSLWTVKNMIILHMSDFLVTVLLVVLGAIVYIIVLTIERDDLVIVVFDKVKSKMKR